jgi:hypothetical protein
LTFNLTSSLIPLSDSLRWLARRRPLTPAGLAVLFHTQIGSRLHTQKLRLLITVNMSFILLILIDSRLAHAAPPLVTDDAAVIDLGGWEYILSVIGDSRPAVDSAELPSLEVSYGIAESMQLTGVLARQVIEERGSKSQSGWGYGQIGYKWRFYGDDDGALAFTPAYSFPVNSSSRIRGLVEDVRVLSLPLVGTITRGHWEFSAQASLDISSNSTNGIGYGVATGYTLTETFSLLAEIYGEEFSGDEQIFSGNEVDDSFTNWRTGFAWEFKPGYSLLAAWGGEIESNLPPEDKLDYEYFLGLQYNTP